MKILTPDEYRVQPWANGRGQTVEMLRIEADGRLVLRLSMATVAEDGAFSIFPGIDRVLTVLTGPGFGLEGAGIDLNCAPLVPVAFPGDVPVQAVRTGGQLSTDFNVMSARGGVAPTVAVLTGEAALQVPSRMAVFALGAARVNGVALPAQHLALLQGDVQIAGGPVIAVAYAA